MFNVAASCLKSPRSLDYESMLAALKETHKLRQGHSLGVRWSVAFPLRWVLGSFRRAHARERGADERDQPLTLER